MNHNPHLVRKVSVC